MSYAKERLFISYYHLSKPIEEYINNKRKELGINIPFSIESYKNGKILKPKATKKIS